MMEMTLAIGFSDFVKVIHVELGIIGNDTCLTNEE